MGSIKELKKNINNISGELFNECLFSRIYLKNADTQKIDKIITKILQKQNEFLKRSKHTDGKNNAKLVTNYYKKLKEDINKHIEEIVFELKNTH